ncbi:MAG TPA: ATP-binding protein [Chloroflexota bacterium]|nr:ATP-binding protein [Chloroflexota bacterium]
MKRVGEALRGRAVPEPTAPAAASVAECPICKGAGWIRADVPVGDPFFGRPIMCQCLMARLDQQRMDELQRMSALDPFRDKTFDNFDAKAPGTKDAYEAARHFAHDPTGWLVLRGGLGCGKTHLAAAITNEAVRSNALVLFEVVPDLLDHLRSTFAPSSPIQYDKLFEGVRSSNLLVLDDLGTESGTPWAQEKLYQIINYRYNYQFPTVITTNRRLEAIDERIQSRIGDQALCKVVEITANDYRALKTGQRRVGTPGRPFPQERRA